MQVRLAKRADRFLTPLVACGLRLIALPRFGAHPDDRVINVPMGSYGAEGVRAEMFLCRTLPSSRCAMRSKRAFAPTVEKSVSRIAYYHGWYFTARLQAAYDAQRPLD